MPVLPPSTVGGGPVREFCPPGCAVALSNERPHGDTKNELSIFLFHKFDAMPIVVFE